MTMFQILGMQNSLKYYKRFACYMAFCPIPTNLSLELVINRCVMTCYKYSSHQYICDTLFTFLFKHTLHEHTDCLFMTDNETPIAKAVFYCLNIIKDVGLCSCTLQCMFLNIE